MQEERSESGLYHQSIRDSGSISRGNDWRNDKSTPALDLEEFTMSGFSMEKKHSAYSLQLKPIFDDSISFNVRVGVK